MINASFEPLAGNFQVTLIQAFAGETGNLSISHGNNSVGGSDFSNITTGGMPSAFAGGTGPFDETGGILGQSALEDTVTTYTFPLVEQGTNVTMPIYSYESGSGVILNQTPNLDYNAEFCQAPISPYTGTQPENYMAFTSNVLLGNATRAKKSSRYYHRVVNGNETDF